MKTKPKEKKFTPPEVLNSAVRVASAYVCCGLGNHNTCGISHSRIS